MRFAMRRAAALSAFIAIAVPAYADFCTTSWGLSVEEALAGFEGAESHSPADAEIFTYDGASYKPLAKMDHELDGVSGEAALLFDAAETLQFIVFSPDDLSQCDALVAALGERHGAADESGFGSTAIYNWTEGGTIIRLTNSADIGICNLSYGAF